MATEKKREGEGGEFKRRQGKMRNHIKNGIKRIFLNFIKYIMSMENSNNN